MSSFQYEKTLSFSFKKKKEPISAKKYLLAKDDENQKYAVFQLTNNYKETVNRIVLIINQYDKNGTFLTKNEVPYEDLAIKSNNKFVPFFKLVLDEQTEKIETQVIEADFEGHKYVDGKMYRVKKEKKKKKEEVEVKPKDTIDKDVKVLKSKFPVKSFLIMSGIVLLVMAIFIGFFSLSNPEVMYKDMSFNKTTGVITKYYGDSKIVTIPEKIQDKEVTAIGNRAFMNKSVMSITIESETITIGEYAFANNSTLMSFSAHKVTRIGNYAFENCKFLEGISTDEIQSVGEGAFQNCTSIKSFSAKECTIVERLAFVNCFQLKEVNVPKASLSSMVFDNNDQLTKLTFGDVGLNNVITLKMIFSNTIDHKNLVINTNIENVRSDFFESFECSRLNFTNPKVKFTGNALNDYISFATRKGAFYEGASYKKAFDVIVSFDSSNITDYLYINEPTLKGIIASDLSVIGRKVSTLDINGDITITNELISCFPNLRELRLGNLVEVDKGAINIVKLEEITMPVIGEKFIDMFMFVPLSFEVSIIGSRNIPEKYFDGATSLTKLTIRDNVHKIGKNAISNCPKLKELVIESSVTEMELPIIDKQAIALTTVTLPFIGSTNNQNAKYLELNESGGLTTKLTIDLPVSLNEKTFEGCTMISYLRINGGIYGESDRSLSPLKGLKTLVLNGSFNNQTLNKLGGAMNVQNVSYEGIVTLPNEFFTNWQITNLFITNSYVLKDTLFSENDYILNIYLSRYCSKDPKKTYSDIFEKIIILRNIYFENNTIAYTGKKNITVGYVKFQEDYERIFG